MSKLIKKGPLLSGPFITSLFFDFNVFVSVISTEVVVD